MKEKIRELPKNIKIMITLIILIISIVCLSELINGREVQIIRSDKTVSTVRAGEIVNFSLIFEREGGFFDTHYEMTGIDSIGDWEISIKGTHIYIPHDSMKEIVFTIQVPENIEDDEWYYYSFGLVEKPLDTSYYGLTFTVYVNNNVTNEIAEGERSVRSEGNTFNPSIFAVIPISIIIFCIFLLIKLCIQTSNRYQSK